jgi:hypothetical protein
MTTQTSEQSFAEFSLDDFSKVSDADRVTVMKFFNNRTTIKIPVCQVALSGNHRRFSLSYELSVNIYVRVFGTQPERKVCRYDPNRLVVDFGDSVYSKLYDAKSRADPILIDEILKIGLVASGEPGSKINLTEVPLEFVENIYIHDYDDLESLECNCQRTIRSLINDESISASELRQRLIELDFLCLAFEVLDHRSYINSLR